ncbi:MAG: dihydropteroate synthase [Desulfobacula sp.]|jgi:5-methyltetrahydrofolate--homocysteine methyltransferase|uniref:dihydropteroate synthase n=1 Tax=Desulfobacula sp. TaxID=2593537 RepID=UPI001DB1A5A0|nr:dihydropteroate synthase [Desulfobacula sp.]MBT3483737.1 dihydropteroate synthase [Desulfobacula sp.]MBT3803487.1 dihydropteroate synthase [Desulfobacula sp.]MBT4023282.1 dihydropteroate synthase [Desulfobacula sp.]MBT4197268.1 dihydropteroate synthase [Desulfobacula sp.]
MFEVIGERINTSRKLVQAAVADRDADYIIDDVQKQQEAGANFIDVNAGARIGHETEDMKWLLDTIQPIATVPLTLDSPDPAVLEMAFKMVEKTPMINSISLEKERFDAMMPFLDGKECKVIALCMDDAGMPNSSDDILARAKSLVQELNKIGIPTAAIYVDPLVQPISVESNKGTMVLDAVRAIKALFPEVHITGGLSNISYGLPQRKIINRTFVSLMMDAGMDSAIIDPLDKKIMATIRTADMLLGQDAFCMNYLKGVRSGAIES